MAYQYAYVMKGLSKAYPGQKPVFKDITLSFLPGAKIAVIGPNGAGKSTLMKVIAGIDKEYQGEAWAAEGIRVGYLAQEPQLDPTKTVRENVTDGVRGVADMVARFNAVAAEMGDPKDDTDFDALMAEMGELQEKIDAVDGWTLDNQLEIAMDALRCPPGDASIDRLSGGEKRRVALCKLLLEKPEILLLDEPTNHLDAESVAWLEKHLQDYAGMCILVTHDRYFLDNVVKWVLELDRGNAIPFEGNYSAWLEAKSKRMAQEGREDESREKAIKDELAWIRSSPKARQSKSKARIKAFDELVEKQANRRLGSAQILIQIPERLGNTVIEAKNLTKSYGDRVLIDDLSFSLPPGGIVGVIGPNGAGKTTLIHQLSGALRPDAGRVLFTGQDLTHADMAALNPRLVCGHLSGYGRTGPYADKGGFDLIAQGFSGLMSITGEPDGRPLKPGPNFADSGAGLHCTIGILAALQQRQSGADWAGCPPARHRQLQTISPASPRTGRPRWSESTALAAPTDRCPHRPRRPAPVAGRCGG